MTRSLRRIRLQSFWEFKLNIRNGEQILLLLIIPILVLIALTQTSFIAGRKWEVGDALAVSITVSVLAAGFTSLAIATAFERRSGTLLAMGTTPLTRFDLVVGKGLSIVYLAFFSTFVLLLVAMALGWRPMWSVLMVFPLLVLGILSVSGIAFLLAGTIRAEAVLALANGIFVIAILFGGILVPYGGSLGTISELFPPAALSTAMRFALGEDGTLLTGLSAPLVSLCVWALLGNLAAAKFFRWR
jgi:ABC-2 type transport system permease protein